MNILYILYILVHILNPLLSIKVPLKVAYKPLLEALLSIKEDSEYGPLYTIKCITCIIIHIIICIVFTYRDIIKNF